MGSKTKKTAARVLACTLVLGAGEVAATNKDVQATIREKSSAIADTIKYGHNGLMEMLHNYWLSLSNPSKFVDEGFAIEQAREVERQIREQGFTNAELKKFLNKTCPDCRIPPKREGKGFFEETLNNVTNFLGITDIPEQEYSLKGLLSNGKYDHDAVVAFEGFRGEIEYACHTLGVPKKNAQEMVMQMYQESRFNPSAWSEHGAYGIGQWKAKKTLNNGGHNNGFGGFDELYRFVNFGYSKKHGFKYIKEREENPMAYELLKPLFKGNRKEVYERSLKDPRMQIYGTVVLMYMKEKDHGKWLEKLKKAFEQAQKEARRASELLVISMCRFS